MIKHNKGDLFLRVAPLLFDWIKIELKNFEWGVRGPD